MKKEMDITNLLEKSLSPNPNPNPNPSFKPNEEVEDDGYEGIRAGRIANAVAFPMVLKAAFEIGVIDAIASAGEGAWVSPSEIARRLPIKPTNPHAPVLLDRMLRLLASYDMVTVQARENGRTGETETVYATKPICRFFLSNNNQDSGSVVPLFLVTHSDVFIKMWSHMKDLILDGTEPFRRAHDMSLYEYLRRNEPFHELFHRAMAEHSTMIMKRLLEVYRGFENVNVLVDVGGSDGTSIALVTSKYPRIKGINFDLPDVIAKAPSYHGVEHVAGDMFVEVPKGDAIIMKRLVHDWNDDDCIKILKNCWKSLPDKGKMIVVETIIPTNPEGGGEYSNFGSDLDVTMLALDGGKERTRSEFEDLATRSGFARCEFVCRAYYCWVIEFHKKEFA
ncbi:PREDICTED: indole glucosinolate O-methyltransferase 3-like [Tarenaya hassleriana]|uniref:indole glucosinolate O-methyltransferase 3-like n=1 Tax=Tarenaya hassleriana TaxID=28532 RepID=UPI00053C6FE5|nr:PREDICTED: indole glucosinolate O-methyltransferase 3-like [Tarenaya hassleriana]